MRKNKVFEILSLIIILAFTGCAKSPKKSQSLNIPSPDLVGSHPYSKRGMVALLPFENQTNNMEAAQKVRQMLYEQMKLKGYRLIELNEIDSQLKILGITDGGQLGALSLKQIRDKIRADRFCYGSVIEFGQKSAVALTQRKVEINLKLVETRTGKVIFEGSESGVTSRAGADAAGDLVVHTAGKVVKSVKEGVKKILPGEKLKKAADLTDVIADVDLTNETQDAIQKLLEKLP